VRLGSSREYMQRSLEPYDYPARGARSIATVSILSKRLMALPRENSSRVAREDLEMRKGKLEVENDVFE
jgi:hypothetical protein